MNDLCNPGQEPFLALFPCLISGSQTPAAKILGYRLHHCDNLVTTGLDVLYYHINRSLTSGAEARELLEILLWSVNRQGLQDWLDYICGVRGRV